MRLNVSKGSGEVDVPSEVGNTPDQAESDLAAQGFKPAVTRVASKISRRHRRQPAQGAQGRSTVRLERLGKAPQAATVPETTTTTTVQETTAGTTTTSQQSRFPFAR